MTTNESTHFLLNVFFACLSLLSCVEWCGFPDVLQGWEGPS